MGDTTIEQVLDQIRKIDAELPDLEKRRNDAARAFSALEVQRSNLTIELTRLVVAANVLDYRHSDLKRQVHRFEGLVNTLTNNTLTNTGKA